MAAKPKAALAYYTSGTPAAVQKGNDTYTHLTDEMDVLQVINLAETLDYLNPVDAIVILGDHGNYQHSYKTVEEILHHAAGKVKPPVVVIADIPEHFCSPFLSHALKDRISILRHGTTAEELALEAVTHHATFGALDHLYTPTAPSQPVAEQSRKTFAPQMKKPGILTPAQQARASEVPVKNNPHLERVVAIVTPDIETPHQARVFRNEFAARGMLAILVHDLHVHEDRRALPPGYDHKSICEIDGMGHGKEGIHMIAISVSPRDAAHTEMMQRHIHRLKLLGFVVDGASVEALKGLPCILLAGVEERVRAGHATPTQNAHMRELRQIQNLRVGEHSAISPPDMAEEAARILNIASQGAKGGKGILRPKPRDLRGGLDL